MAYQLYYWPGLQGRGEFVRLTLEEAQAPYDDVARRGKAGLTAMMRLLQSAGAADQPFAPPFLKAGTTIIPHVANILMFLGAELGLAPKPERARHVLNGFQLTITDMVTEIHDSHHPIAAGQYYEDQKQAAKARSRYFLDDRMPKFLGYFERVLQTNPKGPKYIFGARLSYVDLSLFQIVEGLRYAFPRATADCERRYPALVALRNLVAARPNIAAYMQSDRRVPFNQMGIFRHYPELDRDAA